MQFRIFAIRIIHQSAVCHTCDKRRTFGALYAIKLIQSASENLRFNFDSHYISGIYTQSEEVEIILLKEEIK